MYIEYTLYCPTVRDVCLMVYFIHTAVWYLWAIWALAITVPSGGVYPCLAVCRLSPRCVRSDHFPPVRLSLFDRSAIRYRGKQNEPKEAD